MVLLLAKKCDNKHMPRSSNPSRERQHQEAQPQPQPYGTPRHQSKRQKLNEPTAYWDNLSKIWLTSDALDELDRRNSCPTPTQNDTPSIEPTRSCEPFRFAPDFLHDCPPSCLAQVKRLSRLGGPELSDLRNYPGSGKLSRLMSSGKSSSRRKKQCAGSLSSKTRDAEDTANTAETTSSTPYNRNFQQHLIDHGIYPPEYRYPDGRKVMRPDNWAEINKRLTNPRASLSPSKFSEKEFEEFKEADAYVSKEKPVSSSVVPIIEGKISDPKCIGKEYLFENLASLTDCTLAHAKPDHFYGACPEQLDRQIRKELNDHIVPSMQDDLPMLPNFFLEAKGPDGSLSVATRQSCYDGALGARGIHSLRSFQQDDESTYDHNAYTLTSTYHGGQLKLYTIHPIEPADPACHSQYIMTQLNAWSMTGNLETFRQGASAFRNARDWAKEKRDESIKLANARCSEARCPVSERQTAADTALSILDESEAENHDAQSSFTAPVEDAEEGSQALGRKTKRPRVSDVVPDDAAEKPVPSLPN